MEQIEVGKAVREQLDKLEPTLKRVMDVLSADHINETDGMMIFMFLGATAFAAGFKGGIQDASTEMATATRMFSDMLIHCYGVSMTKKRDT